MRCLFVFFRVVTLMGWLPSTLFAFSISNKNEAGWASSPPPPVPEDYPHLQWQQLGAMVLNLHQQQGLPMEKCLQFRMALPTLQNRCYLAESTIPGAGWGVFAACDCKEGDLLTCYPGDVVLTEKMGLSNLPKELQEMDPKVLQYWLSSYCVGVTEEVSVMGLPHKTDNRAYLGHMINDGTTAIPTTEDEMEAYIDESWPKVNCQFQSLENLHMVTLASRDIAKGEELFVFYGPVYWMDQTATWKGGDDENSEKSTS